MKDFLRFALDYLQILACILLVALAIFTFCASIFLPFLIWGVPGALVSLFVFACWVALAVKLDFEA